MSTEWNTTTTRLLVKTVIKVKDT